MSHEVCRECLSDHYLAGRFDFHLTGECRYCGELTLVVPVNEVVPICEEALHAAFRYVEQSRHVIVHELDYVGDPLPVILDRMLECPERLRDDLAVALLNQWEEWGDDDPCFLEQTYATPEMTSDWAKMERSLHAEARFVNPDAARILEKVFGSIGQLQTVDSTSAIMGIGPGQPMDSLQRARVFENEGAVGQALKHPERHLGPPPAGVSKAGRMNAQGVAVFYGATDELTAIAEVRPPVGSPVVTSVFNIIRPLRLLNLAALSDIRPDPELSYFDPARVEQAQRCGFLTELQTKLLVPVMPGLEEQGYLITQVIADFLSTHPALLLDGIFFPSIQVSNHAGVIPGHNVILFSKSCGLLKQESKYEIEDVSLWEHDEDGALFRQEIWPGQLKERRRRRKDEQFVARSQSQCLHDPALELERKRIRIHRVRGAIYDASVHDVELHGNREMN